MECSKYEYINHAIAQMFKRSISAEDVEATIENGEIIKDYPEDSPFPSQLKLNYVGNRPIHVVVSQDSSTWVCYVITAYEPDSSLWKSDFKSKL
ncbi:MAG: DUF4258 domain-containing protein [Saprospiraceae bacterium]